MKRFQVTSVDNREPPSTRNEVQLNAYNLYSQTNANNGIIPITNSDVESSRKFSFAHLTR